MAIDVKVGLDFGKIVKQLDAVGKSAARAASTPVDKAFERAAKSQASMGKAVKGGGKGGGLLGAAAGIAAGPVGIAAGALIGSSPALQKTLERLIKSIGLLIQPIGDLLAVGLQPLVEILRSLSPIIRAVFRPLTKWLRESLKAAAEALKEQPLVKEGLDPKAKINSLLRDIADDLAKLRIPDALGKLKDWFEEFNNLTFKIPAGGLLKEPVLNAISSFSDGVSNFLNGLKIWWDNLTAKLPDVGKIGGDFFNSVVSLWNSFMKALGPVSTAVGGFFKVMESAWAALTRDVGSVLKPIKDFFMQIWEWVESIAAKFNFKIPKLDNPFGFINDLFGGKAQAGGLLKQGREAGKGAIFQPSFPQQVEVKVKVEASSDFKTSVTSAAVQGAKSSIQNMAQGTTMMSYSPRGY